VFTVCIPVRRPFFSRTREVRKCVWNGSLLYVGAGPSNRGHEPVVQLLRLCNVFVFFDIRVPIHVGLHHIGVLVRGVRRHCIRQPGPHVDGWTAVHLFGRHDRHQEHTVFAKAPRHRHGHPPTDRGKNHSHLLLSDNGFILFSVCPRTYDLNRDNWRTLNNSIRCRYARLANLPCPHLTNSWSAATAKREVTYHHHHTKKLLSACPRKQPKVTTLLSLIILLNNLVSMTYLRGGLWWK